MSSRTRDNCITSVHHGIVSIFNVECKVNWLTSPRPQNIQLFYYFLIKYSHQESDVSGKTCSMIALFQGSTGSSWPFKHLLKGFWNYDVNLSKIINEPCYLSNFEFLSDYVCHKSFLCGKFLWNCQPSKVTCCYTPLQGFHQATIFQYESHKHKAARLRELNLLTYFLYPSAWPVNSVGREIAL